MVKFTRLAFIPATFALLSSAQPVAAGIAINGQVVNPVASSTSANPPTSAATSASNAPQATGGTVLSGVATQAAVTLPVAGN